jgi:chemotaxis protein CheC
MKTLNEQQLATLTTYIREGTADASKALSTWLGRTVQVSMEPLEQVSLDTATEQMGAPEQTVCACCMRVSGAISGQLLFGFDDLSGMMLCDTLLMRDHASTEWGELETSAVMETTNIVGCAFLNSLANIIPKSLVATESGEGTGEAWVPTPPVFIRDYAAAIMQFALMDQTNELDSALVARTQFAIDDSPVEWRLLLVPDSAALLDLARLLT